MKKAFAVIGIISGMGFGSAAQWVKAGIEGSKHDFSKKPWAAGETCGVCHTPHRDEPPKAAPLWDPNANLSKRFGASAGGRNSAPAGGTTLCLRCHDGTVAKVTIAGISRARYVNTHNPGIFAAAHGGTDHPVGVPYPLINKGFHPVTSVMAKETVVLANGRVECISCHDPHGTSGAPHLLVTSNTRSALCLTCHRK
ncbi:MAG: cytochrome c3 family protein [Planctomycetes bacterium]|nr:cytochrome c3 family protein [Planctomycetota bacterium]MBI3832972.1 cytochrome c3 family protein [Planctomycetota bacterium]